MQLDRLDSPKSNRTPADGAQPTLPSTIDTRPEWQRTAEAAKMQKVPDSAPRGDARAILLDALETFAQTGDGTKAGDLFSERWELERMKSREFREAVGRYYEKHGLGEVDGKTMGQLEGMRAAGSIAKGRAAFAALNADLAKRDTLIGAPGVHEALRDYRFTMFQSGVSHFTLEDAIADAEKSIATQMLRLGRATLASEGAETYHVTLAASAIDKYGPLTGLSKKEVTALLAPFADRVAGALNERVTNFKQAPIGLFDRWLNGGPAKMNTLYRELRRSAPDRGELKYQLNTALRERYANTAEDILKSVLADLDKPDSKESRETAHAAAAFRQYYAKIYAWKARLRLRGDGPSAEKLGELKRLDAEVSKKLDVGSASAGRFVAMSFHLLGVILHPFTHLVG